MSLLETTRDLYVARDGPIVQTVSPARDVGARWGPQSTDLYLQRIFIVGEGKALILSSSSCCIPIRAEEI